MNRKRKLTRMVQGLKASRLVSWHSSPCCCEEKENSPRSRVTSVDEDCTALCAALNRPNHTATFTYV